MRSADLCDRGLIALDDLEEAAEIMRGMMAMDPQRADHARHPQGAAATRRSARARGVAPACSSKAASSDERRLPRDSGQRPRAIAPLPPAPNFPSKRSCASRHNGSAAASRARPLRVRATHFRRRSDFALLRLQEPLPLQGKQVLADRRGVHHQRLREIADGSAARRRFAHFHQNGELRGAQPRRGERRIVHLRNPPRGSPQRAAIARTAGKCVRIRRHYRDIPLYNRRDIPISRWGQRPVGVMSATVPGADSGAF